MVARLRRFFDIRPGEGLPVLLSFTYIGVVIAAYVLAKAIRNGLFIEAYGPYALVYVAAASPLVLSLFVPAYAMLAARLGRAPGHDRDAPLLQPQRPGVVVRVQPAPDAAPDRGVLCLGELFRRDCPGARLELRQLAVRHPAGQAAVRADRLRRLARRHRRRLPGQGPGRPARRLHQPAAGRWRVLIALAAAVVAVANTRIQRRGTMRIGAVTASAGAGNGARDPGQPVPAAHRRCRAA